MSQQSSTWSLSVSATKTCKHCGGRHHHRESSHSCPFSRTDTGEAGSASGGSKRGQSSTAGNVLKDWVVLETPDEYTLKFDTQVRSDVFTERAAAHVQSVISNLTEYAKKGGHQSVIDIGRLEVFETVALKGIQMLQLWCSDRLLAKGCRPVEMAEFLVFLGVTIFHQVFFGDLDSGLESLRSVLLFKEKAPREEEIISKKRYNEILSCLSCIPSRSKGEIGHEWNQTIDTDDEFEAEFYEQSRRLFVTDFLTFVIGDSNQVVQSKALNSPMAGPEELKNNVIGDGLFRTILSVRHKRRIRHSDDAAVREVLSDLKMYRSHLDGLLGTTDRVFSKEDLWVALAKLKTAYVMPADTNDHPFISVTDAAKKVSQLRKSKRKTTETAPIPGDASSATLQPTSSRSELENGMKGSRSCRGWSKEARSAVGDEQVKKDAVDVGLVKDHRFVIDDHPFMGREVFAAKTTLPGSDGDETPVIALTYRDYQGKKGDPTRVRRFVECRLAPNLARQLTHTMCMEKKPIPRGTDVYASILFFPCPKCEDPYTCTHRKTPRKEAEERVLAAATPLTCGQRCADWFVLRLFTVTGTSGGSIARRSDEARRFLAKVGEEETEESDPDEGEDDAGAGKSDNRDVEGGYNSDDDWDAENDIIEPALPDLGDRGVSAEESVARTLLNSWVFTRGLSIHSIKFGTINESNIFNVLVKYPWCKHIFHVGLLQSKQYPFLAVSPDAIALVRRPGAHGNAFEYVSCEFKTRSSEHLIELQRKYNSKYLSCTVGDATWWEAVPWAYRGQVIHQAVVTGLNCVLTIAKSDGILYSCFIDVPPEVRQTYMDAFLPYSHLMTWAHDSLSINGPPPDVPVEFGPEGRKVLASHLRLWRAVAKHVTQKGVLPPIKIFKSMPQVVYNGIKGGIDGSTQFVEMLTGACAPTLGLHQCVALRGIKHQIINSFLAYRLLVLARSSGQIPVKLDLEQFRNKLNKVENLQKFAYTLATELVVKSLQMNRNSLGSDEELSESSNDIPLPFPKRPRKADVHDLLESLPKQRFGIIDYFNKHESLKYFRIQTLHGHSSFGTKRLPSGKIKSVQKTCVMCGKVTTTKCTMCTIPLHLTKQGSSTKSCYEKWHSMHVLEATVP